MPVQNTEISDIFYEIADLLEIEGANPFRVRAYRDAARTIEGYHRRIYEMVESGESLEDIPGIGEDLAKKIKEIVTTGNLAFFEKLLSRTPHSLIQLLDISGLGPKRVQKLYQELGITNKNELRAAIEAGKVADLDGFGLKTVENILEALESDSFQQERTRLDIAEQFVDPLEDYLRQLDAVQAVIVAGSYRRRKPTVGDLDIIAVSDEGKRVSEAFVNYDSVADILSQGETKSSVKLRSGLQVDLRIVPEESYGAALLYFTGSKAHNIHLRNMAVDRGLKINEYGVFKNDERILGQTEEEIYEDFDMPYIEPELRKDTGEIEAALNKELPSLVELEDLRGDLQMHTVSSDGDHSVAEMAQAADALGYDYIAITDLSVSKNWTCLTVCKKCLMSSMSFTAIFNSYPKEIYQGRIP
jgi:DNA polymerase (family X)